MPLFDTASIRGVVVAFTLNWEHLECLKGI